jgi:hypothetical protein
LQCCQTRHEEIISTTQFHEVEQVCADKRRILRISGSLDDELATAAMITEQKVLVIALVSIVSVLDPLLLNEFKLAEKTSVQRHEDDAMLIFISNRLALGDVISIGKAAPHNTAAVDEPSVKAEAVSWIGAANMGSQRTALAIHIFFVSKIVVSVAVGHQGWIHFVRRDLDRCAVTPAANKFRREPFFAARILLAFLIQLIAKSLHVLVQLAVNHERAIPCQKVRNRCHREFAGFVRVTQQKLACSQRFPNPFVG